MDQALNLEGALKKLLKIPDRVKPRESTVQDVLSSLLGRKRGEGCVTC